MMTSLQLFEHVDIKKMFGKTLISQALADPDGKTVLVL